MMCKWGDYYKVLKVIDSCVNIEQLKSASKMLGFWLDKHLDTHVYSTTFINHVEKKFKELNGEDISEIPYRTIEVC